MVPSHFCLTRKRFSEKVTYIPNREEMCLPKDQAKQIYKEIEKNKPVNIQIVSQGIKDESKVRNRQVEEEDVGINANLYKEAISNASPKDENKIEQMVNWSFFSDKIRYVHSCMNMMPRLTIRPLEEKKCRKLFSSQEVKEDKIPDIIFDEDRIRETYFDKYNGIQSEISQETRFDESTDLSTTYLGKVDKTRKSVIRGEESFPISGQEYTLGKIPDKTECSILIDTGASKSYISKSFYMRSRIPHTLPKFAPTTQRIQVGNEQYVVVLFIVPVIIEIHGHIYLKCLH